MGTKAAAEDDKIEARSLPPEQHNLLADSATATPQNALSGMSVCGKVRHVVSLVTVEPSLWLYVVSFTMATVATQNLMLEKACRVNLRFDEAACDALSARNTSSFAKEEGEVQQLTAQMVGLRSFIQSSFPALLILFVGSWSDRHARRKPFMLVPLVGEILNAAGHLVCTYFYYELPVEADLFCEAVFPSLTGGWSILFMAAYTYISDITSEDERTFRIGFVNVCAFSGLPIGVSLSGILYDIIGFYGVFGLSLLMNVISLVSCYFLVKETPKKKSEDYAPPETCCGVVKDFFDVWYLKDTAKAAFGHGADRRLRILLLMMVVGCHIGTLTGENTVLYLFLRLQFNWDGLQYSFFSTYIVVVHLMGMGLSIGLLTSWLKLDDSVVGMVACASKIGGALLYAFATTVTFLMFAPVADLFKDTVYIALRAISSKVVPSEDLGKTNSLIGVCEAIAPVICGPLYSAIYQATLHVFPGCFYLVSCSMSTVSLFIFGWFYFISRRQQRKEADEGKTAEDINA